MKTVEDEELEIWGVTAFNKETAVYLGAEERAAARGSAAMLSVVCCTFTHHRGWMSNTRLLEQEYGRSWMLTNYNKAE